MQINGYDDWKLAGPPEPVEIGHQDGDVCNRVPEPDEDAPRGYRPRPCSGEMLALDDGVFCFRCGEMA